MSSDDSELVTGVNERVKGYLKICISNMTDYRPIEGVPYLSLWRSKAFIY